jgi:thiamine biosynthesis lipoprotein
MVNFRYLFMDTNPNIRLHRRLAMGTEFLLYLDPAELDPAAERTLVQAVFAEVDRVETIFSRFRPSSEISRINQLAPLGPVVTDPEVFGLLLQAESIHQLTHGAFDVALGRLSRAWGFAQRSPHLPDPEELAQAQSASGMALVSLDRTWRTVHFLAEGVELDLGALAKGYAVDCALSVLHAAGAAALVDAGHSSLAATGEPFATGWPVEVRAPQLPGQEPTLLSSVRLHTNSLGTSGIMEQKFEQGGQSFSHLFDTRSQGIGNRDQDASAQLLQASVLAPTAALADALSTAMFVLGPVEGSAALAAFPGSAALWVTAQAGCIRTAGYNWPAAQP